MTQKPHRNRVPRSEALTQLALEPATIKDVDTLVAFEQKVADPKIYGPILDAPGAVQEITSNQFYQTASSSSPGRRSAFRYWPGG
jgi:hypothetical protein